MGTADEVGISYEKIKEFMSSPAMGGVVERNQKFVQELTVRNGNVILVKNNRIFKVFSIDKEELKSFFKGGE